MREIRMRRGREQDLAQVREFTKDTFSWGDYLPTVWQGWVNTTRGQLMVAECDGTVVGTINLRLLEHREAWLEGLRVRHEYRRLGVARVMIQAVHDAAQKAGCKVIRLETGARNTAARNVFEHFGYAPVVPYANFGGKHISGAMDGIQLARAADVRQILEIWHGSWMERASKAVVPSAYGWRWWDFTRARLLHDIRQKRVWMTSRAFMNLRPDTGSIDIILLAGAKRDGIRLLKAAGTIAAQEDKTDIFWIAPQVRRVSEWAEEAGLMLDEDGLLIYALEL